MDGLPGKGMSLHELAYGLWSLRGEVDAAGARPPDVYRRTLAKCGLCYVYDYINEVYYAEKGSSYLRTLRVNRSNGAGGLLYPSTNVTISTYTGLYQ